MVQQGKSYHELAHEETLILEQFRTGGAPVDPGYAIVLALLSISQSLKQSARSLRRVARAVEARPSVPPPSGPSLGLHLLFLIAKGIAPMPPISPLTLDPDLFSAIQYACKPTDAQGRPTTPSLSWTSSNPAALEVTSVAADTLSALVTIKGPGSATITVTDPATGVSDSQDVSLVVGPAGPTTTLNLSATPVAK